MERIQIVPESHSHLSKLVYQYRDMQSLMVANDIRPVGLIVHQKPPYTNSLNTFYRMFPYGHEQIYAGFDIDAYKNATEILNNFFLNNIGDPDKSYQGMVDITIDDYRGRITRRARSYQRENKIGAYVLTPTRNELQTAVIPTPDDVETFIENPVATILAIKDSYILTGRLFNGNIYPPVNDAGSILALNQLNKYGGYQHWNLDHLKQFFG